jgi:hypothetical protein
VAGGIFSLWLAGYFWETNLHKTAICAETKPFCFQITMGNVPEW